MRCTSDDTLLLKLSASSSLAALRAELGVVLPALGLIPALGSPVAVVLGYGSLDTNWRRGSLTRPMSLWSELELMRTLGFLADSQDPLSELHSSRHAASNDSVA